jgi:hypothetical protein
MKISKILIYLTTIALSLMLSACERERTGCKVEGATPRPTLQLTDLILQTPEPSSSEGPILVEIKGKMIEVDKLVDYPLCNDNWRGTVFVSCNAQVADAKLDADENPLFFKGCDLNIEPNTLVYVAAHNDAAYYKGCSCHTGEAPLP